MNSKKIFLAFGLLGSICLTGCKGGGTSDEVVNVRDKLSNVVVNLLFAVENAPADAANVEKAINNQLKKDGKPYTVHFEYTAHENYSVTVGEYAKAGYDGAWTHVSKIQNLLQQKIIKTDLIPYIDVWGSKLKEYIPQSAFDQFTNYKTNKLYAIPRNMPTANDRQRMTIRTDWMKEAGLTKVTTLEELDTYLSYCQNRENPDGFYSLMVGYSNAHILREVAPSYYFPINDDKYTVYVDINDPTYTVKAMYKTEAFQAWTAKVNEYVQNGYISSKTISNTENYLYNGLTAALPSYSVVKMSERIDSFVSINPEVNLYEACFESDDNLKVEFYGADNCMVSLANSKNVEEFVDFMNWTKNQKNHDLMCFGVEGVNYYLDAKGNYTYINPDDSSERIPQNKRYAMYNPYYAFNDINFQRFSVNLTDEYIEMVKNCETDDEQGNPVNYIKSPLVGFNIEETTAYKTSYLKVSRAFSIFESLTNGGASDFAAATSDLIASINNNGIDDLISEVQRQINEFCDAKKLK